MSAVGTLSLVNDVKERDGGKLVMARKDMRRLSMSADICHHSDLLSKSANKSFFSSKHFLTTPSIFELPLDPISFTPMPQRNGIVGSTPMDLSTRIYNNLTSWYGVVVPGLNFVWPMT